MKIEKKQSAVDLTDLAVGIVVLGVVVSIGATILISVRDARLTDLDVVSVANESSGALTPGATSSFTVNNRWVSGFTRVSNGSTVLDTSNYTTSISSVDGTGTINLLDPFNTSAQPVNVTYNYYNTSREDFSLADDAAIGIAEYGNWFDIIVIVGVAAVVLALIFMAFGGRNSSGNSTMNY